MTSSQPTEYIHIEITGGHRHAGERGRIAVVDGKILTEAPGGIGRPDRIRVELENCPHGEQWCYAIRSDLKPSKAG